MGYDISLVYTNAVDGADASGTVQSTDPAPGTQVQPGSTITLNVLQEKKDKKRNSPMAPRSERHRQMLANAAQTLASAGYTNIAMTASRYPDVIVVDEQPSGGSMPTPPRGSP